MKLITFSSLIFLLSACSSHQPTSFYLLKAIDTETIQPQQFQQQGITVLVNAIKFPEYLDRPQMVIRDSDYKLQLSEKHRWAEPLKNEFSRVFIADLNHRIVPNHALVYSELNGIKQSMDLSIEVLQLDVNTDDQAVLSVKWRLSPTNKEKQTAIISQKYSTPVSNKDYGARVEAQSKTISLFADHVAKIILSSIQN